MSSRTIRTLRRAAERREKKLAEKAAKLNQQQTQQQPAEPPAPVTPDAPAANSISEARRQQNWENAQFSTGPKSTVNSSQNHTIHGLARHNGAFRLLKSEDSTAFEALKQSLVAEHHPTTPTECILVNGMAESHWLANRAHGLQNTCLDPETGAITNEKMFSLYVRYQNSHTRAFHKCMSDLVKLRTERRKTEIGFEAQTLKQEQHQMKKDHHPFNIFIKDIASYNQYADYVMKMMENKRNVEGYAEEFAAGLDKLGIPLSEREANLTQAA